MNKVLRKIAVLVGLGILFVSMYWSQDGFNFDVAGDSGYGDMALFVGWFLAVSVSVVQFVFSTNFKDLNPSLIIFGVLAYIYSIYTNYHGVLHFQGEATSKIGAAILAIVMDGAAEPLIAWGLYESRSGDFIGNIVKAALGSDGNQERVNRTETRGVSDGERGSRRHNNVGHRSGDHRQINDELRKRLQPKPQPFQNLHGIKYEKPDENEEDLRFLG